MRITWKRSGGFAAVPGLERAHTLDTDALAPEARRQLEDLLAAAHFFELTAAYGAGPPGAPDARTYTITIEDGGKSHAVRRTDPIEDTGLAAVLDWLRAYRAP